MNNEPKKFLPWLKGFIISLKHGDSDNWILVTVLIIIPVLIYLFA